ncbi:MAG TPA: hypothetical protein PK152_14840 [Anaerolineales bacterium]|jgi:hypothetical protein|nr:hypothetical protein [Anaerolineales bacterium]
MEKKSPIVRLLVAVWLLASQIAGGALVVAPLVVLLAFKDMATSDSAPGAFNALLGLGYVLPILFLGLGITAWVMFVKRRDALAGWLGLATLIPGGIMLLGMNLFAP